MLKKWEKWKCSMKKHFHSNQSFTLQRNGNALQSVTSKLLLLFRYSSNSSNTDQPRPGFRVFYAHLGGYSTLILKFFRVFPTLFSAITVYVPASSSCSSFKNNLGPEKYILWSEFSGIVLSPFLVQENFVISGLAAVFMLNTLELFTSKLISFIASMNWGLSENWSQ